jgi:hypothetical protein
MNLLKNLAAPLAVMAVVVCSPSVASAESYTFSSCLTANWVGCSGLPDQMKVDVTDAGGGYVDFKFTNAIGIASSITALYFDAAAGLFKSIKVQSESAGVDFKTESLSPPNTPGANGISPPFVVSVLENGPGKSDNVTLGADTQGSPQGIDAASESLVLRLGLGTGKTFSDIIAALDKGPGVDALRIAAHIQSLPGGQSESIICCDTGTGIPSPEPASMALFGLMAIGAAHRIRRRVATN